MAWNQNYIAQVQRDGFALLDPIAQHFVETAQAIIDHDYKTSKPRSKTERCRMQSSTYWAFFERFASGVSDEDRREFYQVRSRITHGARLRLGDQGLGFSSHALEEGLQHNHLARAVRVVLRNWLEVTPNDPAI